MKQGSLRHCVCSSCMRMKGQRGRLSAVSMSNNMLCFGGNLFWQIAQIIAFSGLSWKLSSSYVNKLAAGNIGRLLSKPSICQNIFPIQTSWHTVYPRSKQPLKQVRHLTRIIPHILHLSYLNCIHCSHSTDSYIATTIAGVGTSSSIPYR